MKKNNLYIIASLFGLMFACLVGLVLVPLFFGIKNLSEDLQSMKNGTAVLVMQNNKIDAFKKDYESYKPNLEKVAGLFIDRQNPVEFIKFLERSARESGISLEISLLATPESENQTMMIFQISSKADFLKLLSFLEVLENGPYLVEIENITMQDQIFGPNTTKVIRNGSVDATLLIKTFTTP